MAEPVNQPPSQAGLAEKTAASQPKSQQQRGPSIHQIYSRPAPIKTFPLPTFYPSNPLSVIYLLSAWVVQIVRPPAAEPSVIHQGFWSPSTCSVHVTDEKSTRALWEQGFYGKGSLSRSEPNWLKRELVRQGTEEGHVSEILTLQRREERQKAKWERARLEQEAIQLTRLAEATPAGPLVLPEGVVDLAQLIAKAPVGPLELLKLPNSDAELQCNHDLKYASDSASQNTGGAEATTSTGFSASSSDTSDSMSPKRQKSVRFSPKVESTFFSLSDPPSPSLSQSNGHTFDPKTLNKDTTSAGENHVANGLVKEETQDKVEIINREHFQLCPEEAFFLAFGLGVLKVATPDSGEQLSNKDLLRLFRQYSYFPPRYEADDPALEPDDNFLVHYAAYHHFRSLGWVPRSGIKFGVDWLLYTRGPVFDHAEFGLIVIPSYSHPSWKAEGKENPKKTWRWMHNLVRVLSHVTKSLVLVYVEVPPRQVFEEKLEMGFTEALKLYKVREIPVKRWSSNRNR